MHAGTRLLLAIGLLCHAVAFAEPDSFKLGNGQNGALTVSAAGSTINSYAVLTAQAASGSTTLSLSTLNGFTANRLVMLIQMTGYASPGSGVAGPFDLSSSAVGAWELGRIATVGTGQITLTAPLSRAFNANDTQVVTVPEYTSVTVNAGASLTAPLWNGNVGGVLAFLATNTVTVNGSLDVSGKGFRGGALVNDTGGTFGCTGMDDTPPVGAEKGDNVSKLYGPSVGGFGNLANGAGGGGCHNAGGGGGGNGGAGGLGGLSYTGDGARPMGGRGGGALTFSALDHFAFGGGGGAGHENNDGGTAGGAGGGILFVRGNALAGTGTLAANGASVGTATDDGAGGGGAGGTLYARFVGSVTCGSMSAFGGKGGDLATNEIGPGGGGGGGVILRQGTSFNCPADVSGGTNGIQPLATSAYGSNYGALAGASGALTAYTSAFTLPPVPTVSAPANNATLATLKPTISGTATGSSTVAIYVDGNFLTRVTPSNGSFSYVATLTEGKHTVQAQGEALGVASTRSTANAFTLDVTPPDTQLGTTPPSTSGNTVSFGFTSPETGSSFECKLDAATFAACTSPTQYTSLVDGSHTFSVRARDVAGNLDASPATYQWVVSQDTDNDGLPDAQELILKTDPNNPDSDADGVPDGVEVLVAHTNPLDDDSDDDGLIDGVEDANHNGKVDPGETDPNKADTDGDGLPDGLERGRTTPQGRNTDLSRFVVDADPSTTTDPLNPDSDGDGLLDGAEDVNHNGKRDADETDPRDPDSDKDGLLDGVERLGKNPTNPLVADTDGDGLSDGVEDANANGVVDPGETDPNQADTDHGGVDDGTERRGHTDPLNGRDDYRIGGAGGCGATGGPPLAPVAMLLALLVLSRRHARRGAAGGAVLVALLARPASAQSSDSFSTAIDVQQFKPAPGRGALFGLHGADVPEGFGEQVGVRFSYATDPLVLQEPASGRIVGRLIDRQTTVDVLVAAGGFGFFELGAAVPFTVQSGQSVPSLGEPFVAGLSSRGVGDLRLAPKARLLDTEGLKLAVVATVVVPTGGANLFLGAAGLGFQPRVVLELRPLGMRLVANLGGNFRKTEQLIDLVVGNELAYGAGLEVPFQVGPAEISGLLAANGLFGLDNRDQRPLEATVGVQARFAESWVVLLGAGRGVVRGYGTPAFRLVAGLSWVSPEPKRAPPPPPVVLDSDGDGIPDDRDVCPREPETFNGYQDDDGCPDIPPPPPVVVKPKPDRDGDGVPDEQDLCPDEPGASPDGCPPD